MFVTILSFQKWILKCFDLVFRYYIWNISFNIIYFLIFPFREGQMPQALTMIQINKVTPVPSVLVITLMSLVYLSSSNIIQLMNYVGFATWLAIGVAVFCVIYLRFKHPEWERPIKVILCSKMFVSLAMDHCFWTEVSVCHSSLCGLALAILVLWYK